MSENAPSQPEQSRLSRVGFDPHRCRECKVRFVWIKKGRCDSCRAFRKVAR